MVLPINLQGFNNFKMIFLTIAQITVEICAISKNILIFV